MSIPPWFEALGIPAACVAQRSSAQERGRRFILHPQPGDRIWRVRVDGCWPRGSGGRRVDYLFWGQSASGHKVVLLVELKGKKFRDALEQIEHTLRRLCKRAEGQGLHDGAHRLSPGHDPHSRGGVRVYAVLSRGKKVRQRLRERERLRQRYGVLVQPKSQRLEIRGIATLVKEG